MPRWSRAGSSVFYTPAQVASLTPVREAVEVQAATRPYLRDCFLCHAWDDRQGAARQLHDFLEAAGVRVWFSEKDLGLGVPMMRAIDKGPCIRKQFKNVGKSKTRHTPEYPGIKERDDIFEEIRLAVKGDGQRVQPYRVQAGTANDGDVYQRYLRPYHTDNRYD